jgi:D-alanine-D-alanine ligase
MPALQRALERESRIGVHALEGSGSSEVAQAPLDHVTAGLLEPALEARLADLSLRVFEALECRDFARIDFRLDATENPIFLEINPLPTFAPDGTFGILAELEGCSISEMLGRCVAAGLERLGLDGGREGNE